MDFNNTPTTRMETWIIIYFDIESSVQLSPKWLWLTVCEPDKFWGKRLQRNQNCAGVYFKSPTSLTYKWHRMRCLRIYNIYDTFSTNKNTEKHLVKGF